MSKTYYFNAEIVLPFLQKELTLLVEKMISIGFCFFSKEMIYDDNCLSQKHLSIDEVVLYFLKRLDDPVYLYAKYEDTFVLVFLEGREEDRITRLGFNIAGNLWERFFLNNEFDCYNVDHSRCLRLLLKITSGYTIASLNAYTEI